MAVFFIFRRQQMYTVIQSLHCSKVSFLQFCHMKRYNKIFTKMWGVYSLLWDTVSHWLLTGHFIRYTLLVLGLTPFCLQNCLNSSWHRFNNVMETFLRDFGPYWHDSITQLLLICRLHIHDANLRFHHITYIYIYIYIWCVCIFFLYFIFNKTNLYCLTHLNYS